MNGPAIMPKPMPVTAWKKAAMAAAACSTRCGEFHPALRPPAGGSPGRPGSHPVPLDHLRVGVQTQARTFGDVDAAADLVPACRGTARPRARHRAIRASLRPRRRPAPAWWPAAPARNRGRGGRPCNVGRLCQSMGLHRVDDAADLGERRLDIVGALRRGSTRRTGSASRGSLPSRWQAPSRGADPGHGVAKSSGGKIGSSSQ